MAIMTGAELITFLQEHPNKESIFRYFGLDDDEYFVKMKLENDKILATCHGTLRHVYKENCWAAGFRWAELTSMELEPLSDEEVPMGLL